MTEIDVQSRRGDASDAELISRVRGGDVSAYGDLFARHRDAATRLARQLVSPSDADDLVSEGFAKVLNVLLAGGGPDVAFRAYLLTAIRRLHVDKIRATARATPTDDLTPYDDGEPFSDTVIAGFEGAAAAKAFASLPERWQLVLWHLEIEGQKPADVAPLLGMSPNAVSALAYRAREGLRTAYLQMHTADLGGDECRWTHDRLGAYVRKGLSRRDANKVETHLETCLKCTAAYLELAEVNSSLAGVIGPMVLGAASAGYLSAAAASQNTVLAAALLRMKDAAAANTQVVVGVVGVTGVAGITALALALTNGGQSNPGTITADPSPPSVSTPAAPNPATPKPTPEPKPTQGPSSPSSPITTFPSAAQPTPAGSTPGTPSTPKPTQAPQTPSTPPTTPPTAPPSTPPTPPPTSSDVSARLAFRPGLGILGQPQTGSLGNVMATVDGIPAGETSTVTIQVVGGVLQQVGDGCTGDGTTTVTCEVAPDDPALNFKVLGIPVSVAVNADVPEDFLDPNMTNNHDSVLLGLL
ncbi:sigma-70 family RNA polymerase sigma factor [Marmoricola sp. RAF53]|uniref:sigma-70 family RNA polymerase sigma factor n=1 Tax=Marmoricola sp. RAF53 TaxID=3233059 RepID=UPI003F9E1348